MKLKNLTAGLFAVLLVVSCKDENKTGGVDAANAPLPETFDVTFNLTIPQDDTFQLFYTQDNSLNFGDDRSVRSVVKGSANPQDVIFKIPADVLPTNIRLDFGSNENQGEVKVNGMKFKYMDKTFEAKDSVVTKYFYMNDFQLTVDKVTQTVKAVKKAGQPYDPLMWSNDLLRDEMAKLYK